MVTFKDFKLKKINIPFDAVFHAMLDESYYLNSNYIKAVYEIDGMQSLNHVVETDDVYARVRFDRILFVVRKDRKVVIAMHTASISYKEMGIELYLSSQGSTGDEKRKLCWHNHKPYADVLPSDKALEPCYETKYSCLSETMHDFDMPWFNAEKKLYDFFSRWVNFYMKKSLDSAYNIVRHIYCTRYANKFGKMYRADKDEERAVVDFSPDHGGEPPLFKYEDNWVPKMVTLNVRQFNLYSKQYKKEIFYRQYREYYINCLEQYFARLDKKILIDINMPDDMRIETYEQFATIERRRNAKLQQIGTADLNRSQELLGSVVASVNAHTKKHHIVDKFPDHTMTHNLW